MPDNTTNRLTRATELNLPDLARVLRTNLGFLAEPAGDLLQAEGWYAAATETIQAGRRDLVEERLRINYLARRLDPFERLVLVTWRQGRSVDSLVWCEASRSRAFLDLLHAQTGASLGSFAAAETYGNLVGRLLSANDVQYQSFWFR